MDLRQLPADEAAARRFSEALWLPYNRDLEAACGRHELVDDDDAAIVDEEVPFRLGRLAEDDYRVTVAVDAPDDAPDDAGVVDAEGELAGFVSTNVEASPDVFEWPDKLLVGDLYVAEPYRGGGLADELMAHAAARAREEDCEEVTLEVDADNERALAFYEKMGFERVRHTMAVDTGDLPV